MNPVPIKNIYYIFCYAWQRFDIGQEVSAQSEDSPDILDLFAKVLINATKSILKRGLDREYIAYSEELQGIRGKIAFGETVKKNLLQKMQAHCVLDELSHDNLQNQILKSSLLRLYRLKELNKSLRDEACSLARKITSVSEIRIKSSDFSRISIHRNNAYYDLAMKICELINDNLLPDQSGIGSKFSNFLNDENKMGLVFEDFVRNFYALEQNLYSVRSEEIRWDMAADDNEHLAYLPSMQTDISLSSPNRKIIIDTKFYRETLQNYMGSEKIHSGHLFQLSAYLDNVIVSEQQKENLEGILLYPTTGKQLNLKYDKRGHKITIYTVDLNREWPEIKRDLLELVHRA